MSIEAWLAQQTTATQQSLAKLRKATPQDFDAFLSLLAGATTSIKPRLVPPLHELWMCVPSELAFRVAIHHCGTANEIEVFRTLAEQALLGPAEVAEFEEHFEASDPLDEFQSWLRNRAYMCQVRDA